MELNPTIVWLILLVLLVVAEIVTMGLTTIWFAGGAFVAVIAAIFGVPVYLQITLFLVVSVVLLYFTRPIAVRFFNKDRARTNVEGLPGSIAIVTGEIDNLFAKGQVTINGMEWSARSTDDAVKIPEGTVVTVQEVQGVKLIVKERKEGM